MNELINFVVALLDKGFYLPWVNLPFVSRWVVATLVIGIPVVYVYETFRYKRLAREVGETIYLAPISVKGGVAKELGSREAGLVLCAHCSAITETFRKVRQRHTSVFATEAIAKEVRQVIALASEGASLNLRLSDFPEMYKIEDELVFKVGPVEIPVGPMVNLLMALFRVLPVPFRRRYLASMIHISLVSSRDETQLLVYQGGPHIGSLDKPLPEENSQGADRTTVLSRTKTVKNLTGLSDLLRDAAFMILDLHGSFVGRNWLGMRYFADGLDALDEYGRTGNEQLMDTAKTSFTRATEADLDNYAALYFYGSMLMVDRTEESIGKAINAFTRALGTKDLISRAFINAGLAYCYAQRFHRLGRRGDEVLHKAYDHAEQARREWKEATNSDRPHPLILWILALVQHVDEGTEEAREEAKARFLTSADLYLKAIASEPNNGILHNNLAWVLLKLAEWGEEDLKPEDGIPQELSGNPAENAEKYFRRSLNLNPSNKLTHANLCLLYATRWYRKKDVEKYLDRCRYHGLMAIRMDPDYINGHRDLSLSLLRYGEFNEAYGYFEKALLLSPSIDKDQEIIDDVLKVLEEMKVSEKELKRWRHPDQRLLEPHESSATTLTLSKNEEKRVKTPVVAGKENS